MEKMTGFQLALTVAFASLLISAVSPAAFANDDDEDGFSRPKSTIFPPAAVPDLDKIPPRGISRNFRLVAHTDFGRAGADNNGNSLAWKDNCLYIGHRGDEAGLLVLNAETLKIINELPRPIGSSTQEHRVVSDLNLLLVMGFGTGSIGVNTLQVWDNTDCVNPVLKSTVDFGAGRPHEFFVWRDPVVPSRVLAYQTISGGPAAAEAPGLRVIDVSNKSAPVLVATFDLRDFGVPRNEAASPANQNTAQSNGIHSISVRDDGKRVYVSHQDAGFFLLDSERLATAAGCDISHLGATPCLRMVNPDVNARLDFSPPGRGNAHSAVKVPGKQVVIVGQEVLGSANCPWGWVRIADIRFENSPKQISTFLLPENLAENCATVGPVAIATATDFTAHNQTVLKNLVLISWRGAGTRAIDISNPFMPHEVGYYFPQTVVGASGRRVRIHMASYPNIKDGLIYVLDRFNGLFVLKYKGPFHEEVDAIKGPCSGNVHPNEDIGSLKGACTP